MTTPHVTSPTPSVGILHEASIVIESMSGLVRRVRTEVSPLDPATDDLIARAAAELDAAARTLQEAVARTQT